MVFRGNQPVPIPGASITDAPGTCVSVNDEWLPYVIGCLEFMMWPEFWDDSTGDTDFAISQVTQLIEALEPCGGEMQVAILRDVKANDTHGGTSNGGTQTRELNSVEGDTEIVELSSNQFRLVPGRYRVQAIVPFCACGRAQARINGASGRYFLLPGTSTRCTVATSEKATVCSFIDDIYVSDGTEWLSVLCETYLVRADYGLGHKSNLGSNEVYTTVTITRLGDA